MNIHVLALFLGVRTQSETEPRFMCSNITEMENTSHKSIMLCFILIFYQLIGEVFYVHRKLQRTNVCRRKTNSVSDSCLTTMLRHNHQKSCQLQARLLQRACQPAFTVYIRACVDVCVAHLALPQMGVITVVITFN